MLHLFLFQGLIRIFSSLTLPNIYKRRLTGLFTSHPTLTLLFKIKIPNSGKWIGELKADLGGFGIGSKGTYQVQVYGGYRFSKLFQATAGYRVLSIDYESEVGGSERFNYDVKTSGPVIRLGFNF